MDQLLDLLRDNVALISIVIVLCIGFFVLRNKATKFESSAEFDSMLSDGKPVVVKFFSNM